MIQRHRHQKLLYPLTFGVSSSLSRRMLGLLMSRWIIGLGWVWRKLIPSATPVSILILWSAVRGVTGVDVNMSCFRMTWSHVKYVAVCTHVDPLKYC